MTFDAGMPLIRLKRRGFCFCGFFFLWFIVCLELFCFVLFLFRFFVGVGEGGGKVSFLSTQAVQPPAETNLPTFLHKVISSMRTTVKEKNSKLLKIVLSCFAYSIYIDTILKRSGGREEEGAGRGGKRGVGGWGVLTMCRYFSHVIIPPAEAEDWSCDSHPGYSLLVRKGSTRERPVSTLIFSLSGAPP